MWESVHVFVTSSNLYYSASSVWKPAMFNVHCVLLTESVKEISSKSHLQPEVQPFHFCTQGRRRVRWSVTNLVPRLLGRKEDPFSKCLGTVQSHYHSLFLTVAGFVWAVQVFPQPLFSCHCTDAVHTSAENWVPLHLLGTTGEGVRVWGCEGEGVRVWGCEGMRVTVWGSI